LFLSYNDYTFLITNEKQRRIRKSD